MDDFEDSFDGGDDGDLFDSDPDSDFEHGNSSAEDQADLTGDDTIDIGWQEIAMFGALSEEIADDEKARLRIEREMNNDQNKEEDEENL